MLALYRFNWHKLSLVNISTQGRPQIQCRAMMKYLQYYAGAVKIAGDVQGTWPEMVTWQECVGQTFPRYVYSAYRGCLVPQHHHGPQSSGWHEGAG